MNITDKARNLADVLKNVCEYSNLQKYTGFVLLNLVEDVNSDIFLAALSRANSVTHEVMLQREQDESSAYIEMTNYIQHLFDSLYNEIQATNETILCVGDNYTCRQGLIMAPRNALKVRRLSSTARLPTKATEGSAGFDLYADEVQDINRGEQVKIVFNLAVEIPTGYVGLIFPRSSIVDIPYRMSNSVGVIDSDYRGGISAVFDKNTSGMEYYAEGDRCAQLVILPQPEVHIEEVAELSDTERGCGGYGSTGKD